MQVLTDLILSRRRKKSRLFLGEVHEDNERLAEIEWAFGKDADEWLEKMAAEMADEIGSVKKDEKKCYC